MELVYFSDVFKFLFKILYGQVISMVDNLIIVVYSGPAVDPQNYPLEDRIIRIKRKHTKITISGRFLVD